MESDLGIHDNFFALGGDSILSIQIVARAQQRGMQLTPRDLFEHQSIAALAGAVRFGAAVAAEQGPVRGAAPLTPIQRWFFTADRPEYGHFNQSMLLRAPADLSMDALRRAFTAVLSHHDALRLRYARVDREWQQRFEGLDVDIPLHTEDLRGYPLWAQTVELQARTQHYQASLDLAQGPLIRLVLFQLGDGARLFWCIHHLAVDGVSWRILLEDLHTAYTQALTGQPLRLPAKTSSFKAWAERLAAHAASDAVAAERTYWQALPVQRLPVDHPRGANRQEHSRHYTLTWDPETTRALLEEVPAAYHTRINDVLLTALALALHDWTGGSQCLIDLEGHGRVPLFEDLDLSRTVGWFTTLHPVALSLPARTGEPEADLGAALKAVKEELRGIPQEGIGHGLLTRCRGEALPQGELLFNYLGQFDQSIEGSLLAFADEPTGRDVGEHGPREHLIDINGAIRQGQLRLTWSYSGECYEANTIEGVANNYQAHLNALIAHCRSGAKGLTPADVPLAGLSQDSLYTRYPGLQDLYPLSPLQQGLLFHALYEPETGVYFEQLHLTLSHLDPVAFQAAWQQQLERHPILRSAFLSDRSPALQVVQADVTLPWTEHDWRSVSEAIQQAQLHALLHRNGRGASIWPRRR